MSVSESNEEMNKFTVVLPMPPTTNNLFVNNRRGGRFPSKAYKAWRAAAAFPLHGDWPDIEDDPWWRWEFIVYGLTKASDLSNRIKAAEDMIVTMTGLKDNRVHDLCAKRRGPHPLHGQCIVVNVEVLG